MQVPLEWRSAINGRNPLGGILEGVDRKAAQDANRIDDVVE